MADNILVLAMVTVTMAGILLGPRRVIPMACVLAIFFLPPDRSLVIPGPIPNLDKYGVVFFPALMLLLISGRDLRRFKLNSTDLLLISFVGATLLANLMVGKSLYQVSSRANTLAVLFLAPYLAGRLWLNDREQLIRFTRTMAACIVIYLPFMLMESFTGMLFRNFVMPYSEYPPPRMFNLYRPYMLVRGGPLGLGSICALTLGLLLAYRSSLPARAMQAIRKVNLQLVCVGVAILSTLSRGPVIGALLVLFLPRICKRRTWLAATAIGLTGVGLFMWMLFNGTAHQVADLLGLGKEGLDETLGYRFMQIDVYSDFVLNRPIWGYGKPIPRIPWMSIIDGFLLLAIMESGLVGITTYTGWMVSMFKRIGRRLGKPLTMIDAMGLAYLSQLGWLLFSSWGDSFITSIHIFIGGGLISAGMAERTREAAAERRRAASR